MIDTSGRHPAVQDVCKHFTFWHLSENLRPISVACTELAMGILSEVEDCPQLTIGLQKLLEAKDAFVRARLNTDA